MERALWVSHKLFAAGFLVTLHKQRVENSWYGGPTTNEATQIESLEESLPRISVLDENKTFGGLQEAEWAIAANCDAVFVDRAISELPTGELARYDFQPNHDLDSRFT